jgi:hypothetical protein
MKLLLTNGYPYPCPDDFDLEKEGYDARDYEVQLTGVTHFEWLHTVTVEFSTIEACEEAKAKTGWADWSSYVLEAGASAEDGYDHPAIIVRDKAYCGFILSNDPTL